MPSKFLHQLTTLIPTKMDIQTKAFTLLLLLFTTLTLTPPTQSTPDYTTLVYKGCANQPLPDPTPLSSLYTTLISQSTTSRFFKITQSSITAVFQCRGDLTNIDCHNCITQIPTLIKNFCGSNPSPNAARVQLLGCYMHYEADGFRQISGLELLYKKCGPTGGGGPGFAERRGAAFAALEGGFAGGGGFYATSYAGVYYPNGVPRRSSDEHSSPGTGTTGKTVAIILGGAVGIGFVIICLLFARNLLKKHDDDDGK
ncbi:hypothetical protein LguiA_030497 [Lonicera macranthoides]